MHVSEVLTHEHRTCDNHFADIERTLLKKDWPAALHAAKTFSDITLHHLQIEEEDLFPALEELLGMRNGPTEVMRLEHAEMRQLLEELKQAIARQDTNSINGISDTLVILMQQHNAKEEQVLYPLANRLASETTGTLLAKLQVNTE